MILTVQGATLCVGQHMGKRLGPMAHERMRFFTTHQYRAIHHQRRDGDGHPLLEWRWVALLAELYTELSTAEYPRSAHLTL